MAKYRYQLETEHKFSTELFNTPAIENALIRAGITQESASNKIVLYSDTRTVAELQNAPGDIKQKHIEAGYGFDRHDSTVVGGNHPGKNRFLTGITVTVTELTGATRPCDGPVHGPHRPHRYPRSAPPRDSAWQPSRAGVFL